MTPHATVTRRRLLTPRAFRPTQLNVGATILLVVAFASLLAPLLAPADPLQQQLDALYQPPGAQHWLGTDDVGRDVLSRVLYGGRDLVVLAVSATVIAVFVGLSLGLAAALWGGWIDTLASRLAEIQLAIPSIVLALIILGLDPGSRIAFIAVLVSAGWVLTFRVARSHTRSVLSKPYIEAARLNGAGSLDVVRGHLLRSLLPLLSVSVTLTAAATAALATNLGFLGLGTRPPQPDWGKMVFDGQASLASSPWLSFAPGAVLVSTLIGLQLVGDGLASRYDRHETAPDPESVPATGSDRAGSHAVEPAGMQNRKLS